MHIARLSAEAIKSNKSKIVHLLDAGIDALVGDYASSDIVQLALGGQLQLWALAEGQKLYGLVVTAIEVYPRAKVFRLVLVVGGEMDKWLDLEAMLEKFALAQGCSRMEAEARPGFARILQSKNYRSRAELIVKHISEGALH
jgi:hypothetical protein